MKRLALVSTLLLISLRIAPAHALDVGQCASVDDMTAMLRAEGQQSVALGTARAEGPVRAVPIIVTVVFSTDAKGSRGYVIQTDRKLGDGATTMCIRNRLANIRLYDVRKPVPPPGAFMKADEAAAARRCKSLLEGGGAPTGCGTLNSILNRLGENRERLLLQGDNQRKQDNGSYGGDDILVTVLVSDKISLSDAGEDELGTINYSTAEGATVISRVFINPRTTEGGERLMGR